MVSVLAEYRRGRHYLPAAILRQELFRDSPTKAAPFVKRDEVQKPFALPPRNADDRRVFAYLHKRGIAPQVIRQFLNSGLLYEDAEHHNCVFVGKNNAGQVK